MRAAIYARISEDREGAGLGVQRQRAECEELAAQNGWTVVHHLQDNDLSAYSGKTRRGYRELLRLIREGSVDVVICWHTDRLHRSPVELEEYIDSCAIHGVVTHSKQAGLIDLSTPSGRMIARQLGAVARYESELRSARVQSAKQAKAARGEYAGGKRPFGWEQDGVTVVPLEAAAINAATMEILTGGSISGITRKWRQDGLTTTGGKPWVRQTVREVLLRPRNAGLRQHRGVIIGTAEWEPIVTPESWHALRRLLTDPARTLTPGPAPKYLGALRYLCGAIMPDGSECGHVLKAGTGGNPTVRVYICTRNPKLDVPHVSVKQETADKYVVQNLLDGMLEQGATLSEDADDATAIDLSGIDSAQEALAAELAAGRLPVTAWMAANAQLADRRKEMEALAAASAEKGVVSRYLGEFELDPRGTWDKMSLEQQRSIMDRYVKVTILPTHNRAGHTPIEKRVRFEWDWTVD